VARENLALALVAAGYLPGFALGAGLLWGFARRKW
jgi:hypothetical protein